MKLLTIDTSSGPLVVASVQDHQVLAQVSETQLKSHSIQLLPAIDQVVQQAGWQPQDLERIVVAQGPGSFTGLRIGVTTAKVLAWTLEKELVGVSSLAVLAGNVPNFAGLIVPVIDARNQNVFAGVYQVVRGELQAVVADCHTSLAQLLLQLQAMALPVQFVGDLPAEDLALIKAQLPDAKFYANNQPQGHVLAHLGQKQTPVVNLDTFIPKYLRQTQAEVVWAHKNPTLDSQNQHYVEDV
ncbi:tRNA (adenosine(37)-N6)-threonylcarbamoyltransferase complex dimerization subunit type 1 TsaB [Bombilactobacillus folatiphilus]|uniref:tRNA (Adenosine(37)-N6)-threonylcarbamoyltransferase complex dimerization subunit type 1 TsaB n=1 Tax=Bombilactobacillus folatiphilus TaxID=2923362 RepID=A0ABY4P9Z5_9LACO|nr:tRNA (adenosine(37)-N6)-threonylcarbamoyltransferase complex dimerization subunit type 1 TsaB [Bombilactobacillus folatiphilus]UQS82432.1 tRNA (adenosine(37)-N6)-threonylcarbamoyltransferase complex dimerization subunit type 1 TsaB [Bombilactobacillus folatiphilus]